MRIGILDTKVNGQQIDNIDLYLEKGYKIINSGHLTKEKFDIVASTWTRLNENRIKSAKIKGIVIKDNDEPGNVVDVDLLKSLNVPYGLIGLWGINTRVKWNMEQIIKYSTPNPKKILVIANTPSHDVLVRELEKIHGNRLNHDIQIFYPYMPTGFTPDGAEYKSSQVSVGDFAQSEILITHLGKDDYSRYWLDGFLPFVKYGALWISTTRGPLYTAKTVNSLVNQNALTAVLDWAWEEDKLLTHKRIIHTGHSSYRSKESGTELAIEVIKAVEAMKERI